MNSTRWYQNNSQLDHWLCFFFPVTNINIFLKNGLLLHLLQDMSVGLPLMVLNLTVGYMAFKWQKSAAWARVSSKLTG